MLGPTVEELYKSFIDEETPFAEDVYKFFGGKESRFSQEEWANQYGQYFAPFDRTDIELGERERDLDYKKARNLLDSTEKATDRVYRSEMDTLGTDISKQMNKGRVLAGRAGLRSGTLEKAVDDTLSMSYEKSKDLGDRLMLAKEESKNKYNTAMVDAALDYDKTVSQEKQDFYDRTMKTLMTLVDQGAFLSTETLPDKLTTVTESGIDDDVLEGIAEGTYLFGEDIYDIKEGTCVPLLDVQGRHVSESNRPVYVWEGGDKDGQRCWQ